MTVGVLVALALLLAARVADSDPVHGDFPDWVIGPFSRPRMQPVIQPSRESTFRCPILERDVRWEELHTFNPAAAVFGGQVVLLYRAEDASGEMKVGGHTSRLGIATSVEGLTFVREPRPSLYPAADGQKDNEWPGGIEDPRLVATEDGRFVCTYTQYNRRLARLAVATTRDFRTWTKHGPAFGKCWGGRFRDLWSKSGSIVSKVVGDQLIATRIGGKYWMYWGEGYVALATSDDLMDWTPVLDGEGQIRKALEPRKQHFDSAFPEGGPAALVMNRGIVVLYNGKNASGVDRDPHLGPGAYSGGQALFSAHDPTILLDRLVMPYFRPELPYEKSGQYRDGTTFTEGLVRFKGSWFLYYGCADSSVGVAVARAR